MKQRIVFFGSGAFGIPTLTELHARHALEMVITQPDRRAGRGSKLSPTPIAAWAQTHAPNIPILKPERVNEQHIVSMIRAMAADAWVVIAFGQKLSKALLADRFAINLHASLLPRWRGAAPINAAILAGDTRTGNSVITLAQQMDAGLVLGQSDRSIENTSTAEELHDLLAADGPELLLRVLAEHASGQLQPQTQDESLVTTASKLSREDAWVDFGAAAHACSCRINGLSPWPGVQVELVAPYQPPPQDGVPHAARRAGSKTVTIKLLRSRVYPGSPPARTPAQSDELPQNGRNGMILDSAKGLLTCGTGVLELLTVQPAGKKPMAWADFARGRVIEPGTCLVSTRTQPQNH